MTHLLRRAVCPLALHALLALLLGCAAPPTAARPAGVRVRQLGAFDRLVAVRAAELCSAAYCSAACLGEWDCGNRTALLSGFELDQVLSDPKRDLQGISGYSAHLNAVVVSFRGTVSTSIANWISNLKAYKINFPYPGTTNASVHDGFYYDYYSAMSAQVLDSVASLRARHPQSAVLVTGHSLGAAMAVLAALEIQTNFSTTPALYTFGQPRVGNSVFAGLVAQHLSAAIRVTNHADIVPHVPLRQMGFQHNPLEAWIHTESGDAAAIKLCDGSGEDPTCSDSVFAPTSILDHLHYLGVPLESGCSGDPVFPVVALSP